MKKILLKKLGLAGIVTAALGIRSYAQDLEPADIPPMLPPGIPYEIKKPLEPTRVHVRTDTVLPDGSIHVLYEWKWFDPNTGLEIPAPPADPNVIPDKPVHIPYPETYVGKKTSRAPHGSEYRRGKDADPAPIPPGYDTLFRLPMYRVDADGNEKEPLYIERVRRE